MRPLPLLFVLLASCECPRVPPSPARDLSCGRVCGSSGTMEPATQRCPAPATPIACWRECRADTPAPIAWCP